MIVATPKMIGLSLHVLCIDENKFHITLYDLSVDDLWVCRESFARNFDVGGLVIKILVNLFVLSSQVDT